MNGPTDALRASVLIVGYNGAAFLRGCLDSLLAMDVPPAEYELLFIDNASSDESAGIVENYEGRFPHLRITWNRENVGFAAAMNQAAELTRAPILAVLNQDTIVERGWLRAILRPFEEDPLVSVVGSRVVYADGSGLYAAALEVLYGGVCVIHEGNRRTDAVSGCALAVRLEDFRRLGGLHAELFMYGEDLDLCHRVRTSGRRVVYARESVVRHCASRRSRATTRTYVFHMLRNRTLVCVRNYRWKRLYLALDVFVLFPLTAATELLRSRNKIRALPWILEARVDSLRRAVRILASQRNGPGFRREARSP